MREEYKKELQDLEARMAKAEIFAERLPCFAEDILRYKYTGEEHWLKFGERYCNIPLAWGIKRGLYESDSDRYVMNYKGGKYREFLFSIYINSVSLFDGHNDFGLYEALKDVPIFHSDTVNSNFYITDNNIKQFLDALDNWYVQAKKQNQVFIAQQRADKARKELEAAEKIIKESA